MGKLRPGEGRVLPRVSVLSGHNATAPDPRAGRLASGQQVVRASPLNFGGNLRQWSQKHILVHSLQGLVLSLSGSGPGVGESRPQGPRMEREPWHPSLTGLSASGASGPSAQGQHSGRRRSTFLEGPAHPSQRDRRVLGQVPQAGRALLPTHLTVTSSAVQVLLCQSPKEKGSPPAQPPLAQWAIDKTQAGSGRDLLPSERDRGRGREEGAGQGRAGRGRGGLGGRSAGGPWEGPPGAQPAPSPCALGCRCWPPSAG